MSTRTAKLMRDLQPPARMSRAARIHARYAAGAMCVGGLLLALGPELPWLESHAPTGKGQITPGQAHYPSSLNAFHLGRFVTVDSGWMHVAGLAYLFVGVLVVVTAASQILRAQPTTAVIAATATALTLCGAFDVLLTKSAIHVGIEADGVHVFSVGYGYTLCSIGGPLALAATCWLWYALRRDHALTGAC